MNETIDPCEDFYKFACGNYIEKEEIPEGFEAISEMFKNSEKILSFILDNLNNQTKPYKFKYLENLLNYHSCLSESKFSRFINFS